MSALFKMSEAIAMLDMVSMSFTLNTPMRKLTLDRSPLSPISLRFMIMVICTSAPWQINLISTYTVKPRITDTLGLKDARHPIREKIMQTKFVPNDVYATQQCRFQIVTGCNMSGKSTFIRSIALLSIMAQIGSL